MMRKWSRNRDPWTSVATRVAVWLSAVLCAETLLILNDMVSAAIISTGPRKQLFSLALHILELLSLNFPSSEGEKEWKIFTYFTVLAFFPLF